MDWTLLLTLIGLAVIFFLMRFKAGLDTAQRGLATTCPNCGYMASYPVCTKCGQAIHVSRE